MAQIQKSSGGSIDAAEVVQSSLKPTPCPTNPGAPAKANQTPSSQPASTAPTPSVQDTAPAKPLEGSKLTIRCDPYYPQSKGLPYYFPSPEDHAVPTKPNTPEFDQWFPDLDVKTACTSVKYDPATHKYFVLR